MKPKKFSCEAQEWYFVRSFMRVENGSGTLDREIEIYKKKGITPLKLFMIAVISVILNGTLQLLPEFTTKNIIGSILAGIIITCIIGAIVTLKKAGSSFNELENTLIVKPTDGEEMVPIYEITEEGIYINYYNQTNQDQMHFINWSNINRIELGIMKYMYTVSDSNSMKAERFKSNIKKEFEKAKQQLGYFPYEPNLEYNDVQAIFLRMDNQRYTELPIPPAWKVNDTYNTFLEEVKKRTLNN